MNKQNNKATVLDSEKYPFTLTANQTPKETGRLISPQKDLKEQLNIPSDKEKFVLPKFDLLKVYFLILQ